MEENSYIDTKRYMDPDFFQNEKKCVFENSWLFAGLSSIIPHPKSHFVCKLPEHSFLITRDELGMVHAFYNNCLHRGTHIAQREGQGDIQCPYHGWRYTHKGYLDDIPKPNGMRGAPCNHGQLKAIHCIEKGGMIWISYANIKPEFDAELLDILHGIEAYRFEEFHPVEARDFHFSINWKIVLENSLDFYHVAFAHSSTVNAHVKNEPTFEKLGKHNLQSLFIAPYSWRSWIDRKTARGGPYTEKQKQSLHKYFLYPNLVLNVLPYHITIMQLWPISPQSCFLRYRFCLRKGAGLLEKARVYASWLASRWILFEDVRLYGGIQEGMNISPFAVQPLHVEEQAVQHFHEQISLSIESSS